ncbi:hypothetical protein KOR42_29290 [Thalassoglobus neptunius]|uniref:Uncharacterized protein n=1 Tax=Thalassoglobus neptunius TaxID=1938619 RepID=A0A5C5WYX9_9PLAN|nr:hypothetical protein KOR42_29290 [Thalassoglobus neptunius]
MSLEIGCTGNLTSKLSIPGNCAPNISTYSSIAIFRLRVCGTDHISDEMDDLDASSAANFLATPLGWGALQITLLTATRLAPS